ncbi:MAG: hypothetical protein LIQ30_10325 [Planctomycetes bacterium]|nr:hypothetical protein [Planctomycetota bacterium]
MRPFFFGLILLVTCAGRSYSEEPAARAERYNGMVEALNAASNRRARVLELIYTELRGPNGREMQEVLRQALSRSNTLILQGVVEAMAMLGDPRDVTNLDALLATSDKLEVKVLVCRLLPAFCLQSERARFNYIHYAVGYDRVPRQGILEPLRRPPLTRRGRLDSNQERLQARVIHSLALQFDPVGAALRYIDDILYSQAARQAVLYFVGNALGNDPGRWERIWSAQGDDIDVRVPDEVEEIRLVALASLADMGAEGLPEVLEAFGRLAAIGDGVILQALFDTMTAMCRTAFVEFPDLNAMQFAAEDAVEAENWRRRRLASGRNLAVFAAGSATAAIERDLDPAVFAAVVTAFGAALAYPDDFPDPDGELAAARDAGIASMEYLLMHPDLTRVKRSAVAGALGEVGTVRAVSALVSIANSPYCSPEFGDDGARFLDTVLDSLRDIAVGAHSGRDNAREALLQLLADTRMFPPIRAGAPPVGAAHMVLWRLQRLSRSNDTGMEPGLWRNRLGW